MMAGNPSWWSMHPPSHQQPSTLLSSSPSLFSSQHVLGSSPCPFNPSPETQELPQSWSQLLLGGLSGDEDKLSPTHFQPKKFENWESHQIINPCSRVPVVNVKQEVSQNNNLYVHGGGEFQASAWPQIVQAASPRSCITSLSSSTTNILDFSHNEADGINNRQQYIDHSSECNSGLATGGANKKARVHPSSSQPPLKVRKEKLGDRITALHQLVSPFGKTDTASVLLEAIGYIRFLQGQIEALSSPYLGTSSANMRNQLCVQGDVNGAFPEDPGQLLNDTCLKRKGALNQDDQHKPKDLRSRGLCLVPLSCTQRVGSDNGADYWAPALGGGF